MWSALFLFLDPMDRQNDPAAQVMDSTLQEVVSARHEVWVRHSARVGSVIESVRMVDPQHSDDCSMSSHMQSAGPYTGLQVVAFPQALSGTRLLRNSVAFDPRYPCTEIRLSLAQGMSAVWCLMIHARCVLPRSQLECAQVVRLSYALRWQRIDYTVWAVCAIT